MAYRKTLVNRFLNLTKATAAATNTPPIVKINNNNNRSSSMRRFFFQSAVPAAEGVNYLPMRDKLVRGLEVLLPPPPPPPLKSEAGMRHNISIEETRKVLRASQMEAVRVRLRGLDKSRVSHSEFIEICCDTCGEFEQGMRIARVLDESGSVIVLGSVVFLRPDQVAKAIESIIPVHNSDKEEDPDPEKVEELKVMEAKKAVIDSQAERLVKRELWFGLGLFLVQTTGFMRLTFWELSWDVMEPVCFFVTSVYFMGGYAFFLRTSRDPSFEGFFQSRFAAKQRKLMKAHNFDADKFNELRNAVATSGAGVARSLNCGQCCSHRDKDKTLLSFTER